jgi:predicted alpha/beta hydrolase family esterase
MKIRDADIVIIPGYRNSGAEHWQSRWQAKMKTARRVEQAEWTKPVRDDWVGAVRDAIAQASGPVVLVAHSLGVACAVHAIQEDEGRALAGKVRGGFFVAPPDVTDPKIRPRHLMTFGPYPRDPLPFPAFVVASRNDHYSRYEKAEEIAADWGAFLVDAGQSGHINAESGHGPWPEGLMVFAEFMKRL